MNQNKLSFESVNLVVDWISFNIQGSIDGHKLALGLTKYFTPSVFSDDILRIGFSSYKKKYNVSVRQYTGSKGYWVGTQISFSRTNDLNHTIKLFDEFLVDSRSQIQNQTNTRYIKLEDFPDGKMLKVNRRNNSLHYRVYQKNGSVRFELEFKHRQTKSVQDSLFHNHLDIFEDKLVLQFLKYSGQVLRLDYAYADWILDFRRRYPLLKTSNKCLLTSYRLLRVTPNIYILHLRIVTLNKY